MAIINARNPYFVSVSDSTLAYATLDIEIYQGDKTTSYTGTPTYSLRKQIIGTRTKISFEFAELIRDYLDMGFDNDYDSPAEDSCRWVRHILTAFDANDVQLSQSTNIDLAFDGYGYFDQGSGYSIENSGVFMTNRIMYVPTGVAPRIQVFTSQDSSLAPTVKFKRNGSTITTHNLSYSEQSEDQIVSLSETNIDTITVDYVGEGGLSQDTIAVKQLDECKYTPYKVTFINKFGVLQDMYFFKKSVENMTTKRESYKSNTLLANNSFATYNHTKRDFNIVGNESISLSSGFVSESFNDVFKELLLSEKVWITKLVNGSTTVLGINIKTSNITYKTSVNDRLVEYTIEFDNSYNVINDIR